MQASYSLVLDFEPENNASALPDWQISYPEDRTISVANTTMVISTAFSSIAESAIQMITKVKSFIKLTENWDGYGAVPPDKSTIDRAILLIKQADKNLLPLYFAAPGPNGEIVIEIKNEIKEAAVYFNPDDTTELILNEGDSIVLEGTLEDNYKDLLLFINS